MSNSAWVRVLPFAVFMAFIGLEGILRWSFNSGFFPLAEDLLLYSYPLRAVAVAVLLLWLWPHYTEIRVKDLLQWRYTFLSVLAGGVIFLFWIQMDWGFATFGEIPGFNPGVYEDSAVRSMMILARLGGAVLVVPLMEEIFWRSFLIRYAIDSDFTRVALGRFTWFSFIVITILFGLEHHLFLAGMLAGALFNLVLYMTRSIMQCIVSHAVTNLALGIYVLQTGQWHFAYSGANRPLIPLQSGPPVPEQTGPGLPL
ncbi:MAG: CAAX prenyl protease-related protein [Desulfuromonas sp.]